MKKKNLKINNLTFDKYFWKEHNKLKVCKEENIDIMIDDSPSTCKKMQANKIRAIYFRGIRGPKIAEDGYLKNHIRIRLCIKRTRH